MAKVYGFRISQTREVYAFEAPTGYGGRPPAERHQVLVAQLVKVSGGWKNGLCCDVFPTASAAANSAIRICYWQTAAA